MGSVDGGMHAFLGSHGDFVSGGTGTANDTIGTTPVRRELVADILGNFYKIARGIDMWRFEDRVCVALVTNIRGSESSLLVNAVKDANTIFDTDSRVGEIVDVDFNDAWLIPVKGLMRDMPIARLCWMW